MTIDNDAVFIEIKKGDQSTILILLAVLFLKMEFNG
jgi:hypothetical protein